jgi:hypothetical protein
MTANSREQQTDAREIATNRFVWQEPVDRTSQWVTRFPRLWSAEKLMDQVNHLRINVNGIEIFYREAGPKDAPVGLLPHRYPCSSYEFRNLIPLLADRWRLIARDFPGCGYSATPADFSYGFDDYSKICSLRSRQR